MSMTDQKFHCKICFKEYKTQEEADECAMNGCGEDGRRLKQTYRIVGEPYLKLSPTQSIFRDELWFGQTLRMQWDKYGRGWDDKDCEEREHLFLMNSAGDIFPALPQELELREIALKTNIEFLKRWSLNSIRRWKDGYKPDPRQTFEKIRGIFLYFMDYGNPACSAFRACWVIGTYMYKVFKFYGYISDVGVKGAAKTKDFIVLAGLSFNGQLETAPTEAVVYREVDATGGALFYDEYDRTKIDENTRGAINAILRSGFQWDGTVGRVKKTKSGGSESYEIERLPTYSPKGIAGIWESDDFSERCFRNVMKKTTNEEVAGRYPTGDEPIFQECRDDLYPFALRYWKDIQDIYNSMENAFGFQARPWDIWRPILSVAKFIGEDIFQEVLQYAQELEEDRKSEESNREEAMLTEGLQKVVVEMPRVDGRYFISEIWDTLKAAAPELYDWDESKQRRSIEKRIGFAFRRVGIQKRRRGGGECLYNNPRSRAGFGWEIWC